MYKDTFYVLNKGNKKDKTIPIMGCPRGGTSMLTYVLYQLGIPIGDNLANDYQLEDEVFKGKKLTRGMADTIEKYDKKYNNWGFKAPDSVYYMDDLKPYLRNPHFLIIFRNPLSIAMSSANRDSRNLSPRLIEMSLNHSKKLERFIKNKTSPIALCSYESILQAPQIFVGNLVNFLHIDVSEKKQKEAINIIDPNKGYKHING